MHRLVHKIYIKKTVREKADHKPCNKDAWGSHIKIIWSMISFYAAAALKAVQDSLKELFQIMADRQLS